MSSLLYFLTLFVDDLFTLKNIPFGILVVICLWFGFAGAAGRKTQMAVAAAVGMLGAIGAIVFGIWTAGW